MPTQNATGSQSTLPCRTPGDDGDMRSGRPVITRRMRRLLNTFLVLLAVLVANSVFLGGTTLAEWLVDQAFKDIVYQWMFIVHLVLGLILVVPFLVFALLHLRRAIGRSNRNAVRAGIGLLTAGLVLVVSGIVLTRVGLFDLRYPTARGIAYWIHVVVPLVAAWLFTLHRLSGPAIHWRFGAVWIGIVVVCTVPVFVFSASDREAPDLTGQSDDPYAPSLSRVAGVDQVDPEVLMRDGYCRQCHANIHRQWKHSAHHLSSFTNPAYRFSVQETRRVARERDGNLGAARWCAGCHDPVPLFSGQFDDPRFDDPARDFTRDRVAGAGVTCITCHAITSIDSVRGNGDYTLTPPTHYPFAFSDHSSLRALSRQLIRANPGFHRQTFLKSLHRTPEFCSACHKVHIPEAVNDYKWIRGQNHYDSFLLSGVSGHGVSSFYYPQRAVKSCGGCHMPGRAADGDPAGDVLDVSGEPKIRGHQFPAANTAIPHLLEFPAWVNERHRQFLDGSMRVDLFGIRKGGTIDGSLSAPLGATVPRLTPGRRYLLEVVVRTLGLGHLFTQGTADSNEVWVEVRLDSRGQAIGSSGGLDADGAVDSWAHFVNSYVLDREANRIDRRNPQDIFTVLYNHQIPPGSADTLHYAFTVPEDMTGSITAEVRLHYRKFDTTYMRYFQGESFEGNDLPVVTLASDRVVFLVGDTERAETSSDSERPAWERWNDYGIGLLRKGGKGQLRQAESAFQVVTELGRPEGLVNLARVYLREGRVTQAADMLRRAVSHDPPGRSWTIAWLSGLVNRQRGDLEAASKDFRSLVENEHPKAAGLGFDFSLDYRVLNQLGIVRYQQGRNASDGDKYLEMAMRRFMQVLEIDPENRTAHYNLARIQDRLGNAEVASRHWSLYRRYKVDDNARDRVIAEHRRQNAAADHAAEDVVIYDLQRPGRPDDPVAPEQLLRGLRADTGSRGTP